MRQTGQVISSDKDHALVQIVRQSACGGDCNSCRGTCNTIGVLISTSNPIAAKKGEFVYIDSETSNILKIAALFYIVPLIVIVAGIILSKVYFFPNNSDTFSDIIALIIGAILYSCSLFLIHLVTKKKTIEYTISRRQK